MRKLGCFSAVAAALLMSAGTAHADPFTVTADLQAPRNAVQSARGADDLWLNGLVKVNGPAAERMFVADSIIIFGGDAVSVPNDAVSFTVTPDTSASADSSSKVRGWLSHGNSGFFFSGGVDTLSAAVGSHMTAPTTAAVTAGSSSSSSPGVSLNVPGASGAYDPLSPNFGAIGVTVLTGNQQLNGAVVGTSQFLAALEAVLTGNFSGSSNFGASANTNDPPADPVTTASVLAGTAAADPTTPEPSPLLLLAAGLGLVVMVKRNTFGVRNA